MYTSNTFSNRLHKRGNDGGTSGAVRRERLNSVAGD